MNNYNQSFTQSTKLLATIIFSCCALLITSCKSDDENISDPNALKACFTVSLDTEAGKPITFDASCSQNANSFFWDFGNEDTSTQANPVYTYTTAGEYTVNLSVTSENGGTDEFSMVVTVIEIPTFRHTGEIFEDEIWERGIHYVSRYVSIIDATVTIAAGAVVKISEEGYIGIGTSSESTNAQLIAEGTADDPILITADTDTPVKGYYTGLIFGMGDNGQSSLKHCTIEYAGFAYTTGPAVDVRGTEIAIDNTVIRHCSGYGIEVSDSGYFHSFTNNSVTDCDATSLMMNPNGVHTVTSATNSLESATPFAVTGGYYTRTDETWEKLNWDYVIVGTISIGSETGSKLTIAPGVTIKMGNFTNIRVGYDAFKPGTFIANGTVEEKITFTSNEANPAAADWGGLKFSRENINSSLNHCILEYGGRNFSNYMAPIRLEWTSISVNNTIVRESAPYAVWLNEEAYFDSFENNQIVNPDAAGILIHGNWVHTLGAQLNIESIRPLEVQGDDITNTATWKAYSFPYYTNGWFYIGSDAGNTLTIEPGVNILMEAGRSIYVGGSAYYTNPGTLVADGTPENPIVFSSRNVPPAAADWRSIQMYGGTSAGTLLDNCLIEYAGDNGTESIFISDVNTAPTISSCTISNSGGFGITSINSNPVFSNNVFIDNVKADFNIQ